MPLSVMKKTRDRYALSKAVILDMAWISRLGLGKPCCVKRVALKELAWTPATGTSVIESREEAPRNAILQGTLKQAGYVHARKAMREQIAK